MDARKLETLDSIVKKMSPPRKQVPSARALAAARMTALAALTHRRFALGTALAIATALVIALAASFRTAASIVGAASPLPPLHPDGEAVSLAAFDGQTVLVNFWASWCLACRDEHGLLTTLSNQDGVAVVGVNSQDRRADAIRWLSFFGNPYCRIGYDPTGDAADTLKVTAFPTSLVVGPDGQVLHRHEGPLNEQVIQQHLLPFVSRPVDPGGSPPCDKHLSDARAPDV